MAKVLIVDDDEMFSEVLSSMVERMGHDVVTALTLAEAVAAAEVGDFDVVFLDVRMPDGSGLDALPQIRGVKSEPEVIIITGLGDPDGAELAIKSGAWDYIEKPSSIKEMRLPLVRALQYREEKGAGKPAVSLQRRGIVGESPGLQACLDVLAQAATGETNVLITGETGTGKELFARAIHDNSARAPKGFVVVDCAALPETLVESILFGYEKGAFTGADRSQEGLVKQADGGTLFLDEVGELPVSMQKAFLRVIEGHRFRPVGGKREMDADFRLVAATNRDLEAMVDIGQFRRDLLFRLRTLSINVPPLRERREDIQPLAMYHVARLCERNRMGTKGFSPDFLETLTAYDWPGNVRELIHTLERALTAAREEPTLFPNHLPTELRIQVARASLGPEPGAVPAQPAVVDWRVGFPTLKELRDASLAKLEKDYLRELMERTGGNVSQACDVSGLRRSRLYELLKKYELS